MDSNNDNDTEFLSSVSAGYHILRRAYLGREIYLYTQEKLFQSISLFLSLVSFRLVARFANFPSRCNGCRSLDVFPDSRTTWNDGSRKTNDIVFSSEMGYCFSGCNHPSAPLIC